MCRRVRVRDSVLDCASPLAHLDYNLPHEKRQRAGAVQDLTDIRIVVEKDWTVIHFDALGLSVTWITRLSATHAAQPMRLYQR